MSALIRFIVLTLLSRIPVVLSARVLAKVGRRPVRLLLSWVLQPLLAALLATLSSRVNRGFDRQQAGTQQADTRQTRAYRQGAASDLRRRLRRQP